LSASDIEGQELGRSRTRRGRVLIGAVKSSGSAKRVAIPKTDALYRKRQHTFNNTTFIISTLKQLFLINLLKKRKREWQLRRKTRRINTFNLVSFLVVLNFAICIRELKANLQLKRFG
jgi:hypothetical protein